MNKIYTGYKPRPHQEWLHRNLKRFNVLACHRRFGKTVFSINEMVDQGLRNKKKNPQYAYIAPTYGQAKRVAWQMLKDAVMKIPGVKINESELRVDIPRDSGDFIRFMLLGAENPDTLRGIHLDGCILDEFATMDPTAWTQVIRPALSDRKGWAIFISTPKGTNHFQKMYMMARKEGGDWFAATFKASQTKIIPESELKAAQATMSPEEYDQEYECSFTAALVGAYFGKEMAAAEREKRIIRFPMEPGYPVDCGFDLGMDDSTSIWFVQQVGREIRSVDYFETNGQGIPEIAKAMKEKGYTYRYLYLPHDISVRDLSVGKGKTRLDTLQEFKLTAKSHHIIIPKVKKKEDSIHAARMLIPKMVFHEDNCYQGIEALKSYERAFDPKERVFRTMPKRNWATHGADAFQTLAMGFRGDFDQMDVRHLPSKLDIDYDIFGV